MYSDFQVNKKLVKSTNGFNPNYLRNSNCINPMQCATTTMRILEAGHSSEDSHQAANQETYNTPND